LSLIQNFGEDLSSEITSTPLKQIQLTDQIRSDKRRR